MLIVLASDRWPRRCRMDAKWDLRSGVRLRYFLESVEKVLD